MLTWKVVVEPVQQRPHQKIATTNIPVYIIGLAGVLGTKGQTQKAWLSWLAPRKKIELFAGNGV